MLNHIPAHSSICYQLNLEPPAMKLHKTYLPQPHTTQLLLHFKVINCQFLKVCEVSHTQLKNLSQTTHPLTGSPMRVKISILSRFTPYSFEFGCNLVFLQERKFTFVSTLSLCIEFLPAAPFHQHDLECGSG